MEVWLKPRARLRQAAYCSRLEPELQEGQGQEVAGWHMHGVFIAEPAQFGLADNYYTQSWNRFLGNHWAPPV